MSTGFAEHDSDGAAAPARTIETTVAGVVFVLLLVLAVIWPDPVLWINRAFFNRPISVSEVSFLGREAPRWDVVYWFLVGVAVLALLHGRLGRVTEAWPAFREDVGMLRRRLWARLRRPRPGPLAGILVAGVALVVTSYLVFDAPAIAVITGWRADWLRDWIRLTNRFGGGANPPMIVLFFILGGLALRRRGWSRLGVTMAVSGLVAGAISSLLKRLVERARPDIWLGHDVFGWQGETSFPSGHTIGAFALAVVILAGSRSQALRTAALLLAFSVGATRVLALRHWPSDVLMSAVLGSVVGLFVAGAMYRRDADGDVQESS
ncbi:MAG: phosphatase PAP2 family protein [Thermoanaerobaculia bacterium]